MRLRSETWTIGQARWKLYKSLLHHFKMYELWSTNGLKLDWSFTHSLQILRFTSLPMVAYLGFW